MTVIRDATADDAAAIAGLLNALLDSTTYIYTETPYTEANRLAWLARQRERDFPVLVADRDGEVVAYAAYGDFRDSTALPGYRFTVEHSVHVARAAWGTGVGRRLVEALVDRARAAGVRTMVGVIDASNVDSIAFHARLGFVETARMPGIGFKHGRWLDLVMMQRAIPPTGPDASG